MEVALTAAAAVGLANGYLLYAWRYGTLFLSVRARLEASDGFSARLLSCPVCLAPWLGLAATAAALRPGSVAEANTVQRLYRFCVCFAL
jgi:hypothetical protein